MWLLSTKHTDFSEVWGLTPTTKNKCLWLLENVDWMLKESLPRPVCVVLMVLSNVKLKTRNVGFPVAYFHS